MALTVSQLTWIARLTREPYATITSAYAAAGLNSFQETILADDVDLWELIENRHIRYKGDGVDLDNDRKREAIFYRVRDMLRLPFKLYQLNVELMELFEIEVGQNFG